MSVALAIQHAKRMRCIINSYLWLVWLFHIFPHLLTKGKIFGGKVREYKTCFWIFSTAIVWNISHSTESSARYHIVHRTSCKVPIVLVIFWWNLNFIEEFSKFYILLTVHHVMILGKWPTWCKNAFLYVYFYL